MHTNLSPAATSNATAFSPPPPRSCVTLITVEASLSRSPPKRKCHSAQAESRWLLTAFFAASNPRRGCRLHGMTIPVLALSWGTVVVILATPRTRVTPRRRSLVGSSPCFMLRNHVGLMFFQVFAFSKRSETIGSVARRNHARMRFASSRFQAVRASGRVSEKCFSCFCQKTLNKNQPTI